MKKHCLFLVIIFLQINAFSQTISPSKTDELCPGTNITFSVSMAASKITSVTPKALNIPPTVIQQPFNITYIGNNATFNFIGKFVDYNDLQTFTVNYIDANNLSQTFDFTFTKIKSLLTANPFSQVFPAPNTITANRCQIQDFDITFSNVQYGNIYVQPAIGYGTITNYEYLLPVGWKLNYGSPSDGVTWLPGNNNVTVTSDLFMAI